MVYNVKLGQLKEYKYYFLYVSHSVMSLKNVQTNVLGLLLVKPFYYRLLFK